MHKRINRGEDVDRDRQRDEVQEVLRGMHHSSEDFESLTMSEVKVIVQPVNLSATFNHQLLPNIDDF